MSAANYPLPRSHGPAFALALALNVAAVGGWGCAAEAPARRGVRPELVMAYDDGRPTGTMAFPTTSYQSVMRFELPAGDHRPLRLRLQLGAAGTIEVTVYDNAPMDMPGQPLFSFTRELLATDVSNGRDGIWLTTELDLLPAVDGVIWIGVRKVSGNPTVWTTAASSGQAFVRDGDPQRTMGLLPVRRTPMVRLELLP